MTITVTDLKARILRALDDPDAARFEDELLDDAIAAALVAILPWCPRLATASLAPNTTVLYDLPADCYSVEMVYTVNGEPIVPAVLSPDRYRGDSAAGNDWIVYPTGKLMFSQVPEDSIQVFYTAFWLIESGSIGVPTYVVTGLIFYAAAYCLVPDSTSSANIRQYASKAADSGTPEDNPIATRVRELLKLFEAEMKRHAPHMKASRI